MVIQSRLCFEGPLPVSRARVSSPAVMQSSPSPSAEKRCFSAPSTAAGELGTAGDVALGVAVGAEGLSAATCKLKLPLVAALTCDRPRR
jgi:hypothetical protein